MKWPMCNSKRCATQSSINDGSYKTLCTCAQCTYHKRCSHFGRVSDAQPTLDFIFLNSASAQHNKYIASTQDKRSVFFKKTCGHNNSEMHTSEFIS